MEERDIYKTAKKIVEKKKGFYKHLSAYIAVTFFFIAMNLLTFGEEPQLWFFYPVLPWGIGLIIHYLSVFGFPGSKALSPEWEEEQVAREILRLRQKQGYYAEKGDAEQEDSLELKELRREKQGKWEDEDLV